MVRPVFKNVAKSEINIDCGEIDKQVQSGNGDNANAYIITNSRSVTERKRDNLIDLIIECSSNYDDVVLISGIDETEGSIALSPMDEEKGPVAFKIFFQGKSTAEATVSNDPDVDLFLKDLFIRIQKLTNNQFTVFSYHDHIGYEKQGMFPLSSENQDPENDDKQFISIEDYPGLKKDIPRIVKTMNKTIAQYEAGEK